MNSILFTELEMQFTLQSVQLRRREETKDEEAKTVKRPAEDMPPPKRPRKVEAINRKNAKTAKELTKDHDRELRA